MFDFCQMQLFSILKTPIVQASVDNDDKDLAKKNVYPLL